MPRDKDTIEYAGFVQIQLSEQDISILERTEMSAEEVFLWLSAISKQQFRIAITPDAKSKTIKATLQCVDPTSTARGWMLSGESGNLLDALIVLRYKHEGKMNGDWVPFLTKAREVTRFR